MAPLRDVEKINTRLDAVDDLMKHQGAVDVLRARFGKLPDLEKLLAKVFTYSIKHCIDAVYFEDVSLQKMREFRQLLNCLKHIKFSLDSLTELIKQKKLKSLRLKALLTD